MYRGKCARKMFVFWVSLCLFGGLGVNPVCCGRMPKEVNIGIFLDEDEDLRMTKIAIRSATNRMNMYSKTQYYLKPHVHSVNKKDMFKTSQILCQLLENGVAAIFGPESPEINEIIQSASVSLEIPQFQTFWNPKLASFSTQLLQSDKSIQVFNLYPNPETLSQAVATLVRENNWKSYTVIYDNDDGLLRLQETLNQLDPKHPAVSFRKLGSGSDHRSLLKEIKKSGEVKFLLDCEVGRILDVLQQAREVKLLEEYHSYIITNLDAHTLDWSDFVHIKANVTCLRLLDANNTSLNVAVRDWELVELNERYPMELRPEKVRTKTALLYDAINFFMNAFAILEATEKLIINPIRCDNNYDIISSHGYRFSMFVKEMNMTKGDLPGPISGPISFDRLGQRKGYKLQIIEFKSKFRVAATWNSMAPNEMTPIVSEAEREKELQTRLRSKTFKVVSRIGSPYLMMKNASAGKELQGNDRFEGYAMDLIEGICQILECNYTFDLVPDQHYGNYDPVKKEWDGLIRHLLDRKADLAVCDLTITYERRKAVDFTMPFMTLGISILYAKAVKEPPPLLSFSHPLSLDVWLYMATSYLVISMIIFLVARLNPNDWENPHPCDPNPQELENIWSIRNCCWLTLGSIMAQGCDILPKGISTRMVSAVWWFFSLIMTASYTANLAAFLTMERMGPTIESAEDLAAQTKIKYGCLKGGATSSFFKDTNFSTYHRMWVQMESAVPSVFEESNDEGVKAVLSSKRKYAFLMESSSIEYEMERDCNLMQVGGLLDSKGYGIAMPTNAEYRKSFNEAILKMQEMGKLQRLKDKWWKEKNGGGKCRKDKHSAEETATELGLDHVGGVFVVLAAGIFIALSFAACEFMWNVKKIAVRHHVTLKDAFYQEMKFALNIWARQKAVDRTPIHVSKEKLNN